MNIHELQGYRAHFQHELHDIGEVVVAGGAVRDCLRGETPKDIDMFILDTDFEKDKDEILCRLRDYKPIDSVVEWHKSEPFLVANLEYKGVNIQIMTSYQKGVSSLISTFDWNVCLFGLTAGGPFMAESLKQIGPGNTLRLNKITYPKATLRRGFRFSERFHMKLLDKDIYELCQMVIKTRGQR